jgi:neutral ceramidase
MFQAGVSKVELEVYFPGVGMLGYGRANNIMRDKLTALYVRTVYFTEVANDHRFIFVNCELAFTTDIIRVEVMKKLRSIDPGLLKNDSELMITNQHTHSGPGGFSHHPFYNFTTPGFRPEIFAAVVNGIVESIVKAHKNMQPVQLKASRGEFESDIDVAFNRSIRAYNKNKEVKKKTNFEVHLAVDRTMDLLRIDDLEGNPVAQINFFGVHTTSLGNKVNKMAGDNKGYASAFFEEDIGGNFIAIFAQKIAGDVSPNFHGRGKQKQKKYRWSKGPYNDDVENAKFNGRLQYYKAKEIWEDAGKSEKIDGSIDTELVSHDFANRKVDPDFAFGKKDAETCYACHGMAFLNGTPVDGKGAGLFINALGITSSYIIRVGEKIIGIIKNETYRKEVKRKYQLQRPKHIVFETGKGILLGTHMIDKIIFPKFIEKGIGEMKAEYNKGALREYPWTAHILPIQLARLGNFCFVGFPGEITTIAGKRLETMLLEELKPAGVDQVIICSYANNYLGYCTTWEEYQAQCYEGGHTVFGQWTHAAFMTEYRKLAREFIKPREERDLDRSLKYNEFSEKEISLRTYQPKNKKLAHQ